MKLENAEAQMRKGILEYCALLIISRHDSYAPDIIAYLKKAGLIVVEGTVYPLLTRLKNSGLVIYRWEESVQGPPRKYYSITEQGLLFLSQLDTAWATISQCIETLKIQDKSLQ